MYRQKFDSKYGAKKTNYDGLKYDSKGEAGYAEQLDWLKKSGEIKEWYRQVKISLDVEGVHICNYFVDFKVITKHDSVEYHEYKGYETPEWKLKWKLFQALIEKIDPGAELIVIKSQGKPNKLFQKGRNKAKK
jgi:hypothetical protein